MFPIPCGRVIEFFYLERHGDIQTHFILFASGNSNGSSKSTGERDTLTHALRSYEKTRPEKCTAIGGAGPLFELRVQKGAQRMAGGVWWPI